ncbi:MAG TPA: VOC family protein [Acidothermaceae bacterium]|nr:VOC family protein [Acidothermaceae bacterium]
MAPKLVSLTWDSTDPVRLARFWAAALEWQISDDGATVLPTDGTTFTLSFNLSTQERVGHNRVHLDLSSTSVADQNAAVARFVDLGAREIDIGQGPDARHVVLADPDGNPFCVLEPGNNFVSRTSRFGSITCDGTRQVGLFWSAALEWPLVWDQNEETAIKDPDGAGQLITWGGPPIPAKHGKNRLHLDLAPAPIGGQAAEVERLLSLGARRIDIGQGDVPWVVLADPDENEFCVLAPGRTTH